MGLVEVYVNLKDYQAFDIKAYQLQQNEALECIQALEKQITKKPIIEAEGEKTVSGVCPGCGKHLVYIKHGLNPRMKSYCNNCGQHIDWSA